MSTQPHHTAARNGAASGGGSGGGGHQNGFNEPLKSPSAGHHQQTNTDQHQQPNVRHIPIYVEGRDEPLMNKTNDHHKVDGGADQYYQQQKQYQPQHHHHTRDSSPKPAPNIGGGSLFDRVKNFPTINLKNQSQPRRSDSPNRTIPINVQHSNSNLAPQPQAQQQQQPQQRPNVNTVPPQQQQQSAAMQQSLSSIQKIQNIQKDVLELMDHVEKFTGTSRKDRQYLYLDEMLTQNLLKLDTIDADGQENIKQARREAIKCINRCIAVLEAKADAGNQQQLQRSDDVPRPTNTGNDSDRRISERSDQ